MRQIREVTCLGLVCLAQAGLARCTPSASLAIGAPHWLLSLMFTSKPPQSLAEEYGAEARTSEEIIADPSIDAVLVATSTDTHSDLIEAATAAGKAVLCEKPVDLSLARRGPALRG